MKYRNKIVVISAIARTLTLSELQKIFHGGRVVCENPDEYAFSVYFNDFSIYIWKCIFDGVDDPGDYFGEEDIRDADDLVRDEIIRWWKNAGFTYELSQDGISDKEGAARFLWLTASFCKKVEGAIFVETDDWIIPYGIYSPQRLAIKNSCSP